MPKKRGNGEGSIYRRKDGLWVGQYKIQAHDGTKTRYIYPKTKKGAASKLADAVAERDSGLLYDCDSVSLGDSTWGGGWRPRKARSGNARG